MGEVEIRWILAGVGALVIALIYLWGMRSHIRERLRERRRRAATRSLENEPALESESHEPSDFEEFSRDHPLAERMLVDVEINPVEHHGAEAPEVKPAEPQTPASEDPTPSAQAPSRPPPAEIPAEPPPEEAEPRKESPKPPEAVQEKEPPPAKELRKPPPEPAAPAEPPPEPPGRTVLLTVVAPEGRPFKGPSILLAAQELKLKLHKSGLFDYFPEGQVRGKPVFSIAHLREPGTFNLDTIGTLSTPGLLLFMNLPGPLGAMESVDLMVSVAKQLTRKLGGSICDEKRKKMTPQDLLRLKNEMARFERWLQSR